MCRLIVSSVLCHASLNSRAYFVGARPSNIQRNFINKVLTKIRNKQRINKSNEQLTEQSKRMVTLPYINGTSEMTARLLRPFNIDVAHKPSHKLRSYFTKHEDKTAITETNNAIYMIPCGDCSQRYIGQTSKKIATRITKHKNATKRHDLKSLPATHTYDKSTIVTLSTGQKHNY